MIVDETIGTKLECHHCKDDCPDDSIIDGEKVFCCYGCKSVNELLEQSNLQSFYSETAKKNKSESILKSERKYVFLDDDDVRKQLLRFHDDELSVVKFALPGIHCSSCIYLLEHLPKLKIGILKSEVNFVKKEVVVSFHHDKCSMKDLAILLSQIGYPPAISLDSLDETKKHISKSNLGAKIAVAGFCFGNAMLMSMPEYLDRNFQLTNDFKELFGWINLGMALPVVFFAASDYFTKAWKGLRFGQINIEVPIALGVLTLFLRSAFEIISQTGVGYVDSLAGLIFFLLIGKWYQSKTYQALSFDREYASYFPVSVTCMVDNAELSRTLKELKVGDHVVIHNDELIPADGLIIAGNGRVDYSFVTGESIPVHKTIGNMVYAGGRQQGAEIIVELTAEVKSSELTRLWNSPTFVKSNDHLQNWVDKISKYFTAIIILLAIGTGIYWYFEDSMRVWNSVTAVLIVACPCALALVLPFAYGHAMRILGRSGLYLKKAEVIEEMSKVDSIVFDKTGTLTKPQAGIKFFGDPLTTNQQQLLKSALGNSSHPLSRLLHEQIPPCEKLPITDFQEELGQGFVAVIANQEVKVGSAEYLSVESNSTINESEVHVSIGSYRGYFTIKSEYRDGIFDMLDKLKPNYKLCLLSGDNDSEANRLTPFFHELAFQQKPNNKLDFLECRNSYDLMVGDGLNDAGALKNASVGIAVAEDIHQFSPACDAILSAKKVTRIPPFLKFSKRVVTIVFLAFGLSFLYNVVGLTFAISGNLTPLLSAILMPISSVTVVGFVTLLVNHSKKLIL